MQKFQFFTASPLKMRACDTGRKFAECDQRGDVMGVFVVVASTLVFSKMTHFPTFETLFSCGWT
jgi:hypothetical protein